MVAIGKIDGVIVEVPDIAARNLLNKCNEPIAILPAGKSDFIQPIPFDEWNIGIKALLIFRKPEDRGIGDIAEHQIGAIGGNKFKEWYKSIFNKDCNCGARKLKLNQQYPLYLVPK